ncbi:MAG: LemA family protein [gamma proteobacterium endosymbiont of Lamellibrachia anaximandri]|nr:LemA family protein [gamma proteobacterium endosymbiont of Lamellibrachia anaximandri]MBL3532614.1 LemA family protein [gamma proteobacterium endosymbiont of Lamellibrachia anaximandri]MBL3599063.1 LemA family protein [gamma proteobacterium endosymbiont of Lamellibrachia anaximandri]
MEIVLFVIAGMAIATLIYGIMIYNNLVRLKHSVTQAWSNIDVLLKQRHDELPKLVETCKQYMKFEQETLERVMLARSAVASARQQGDIGAVGNAEGALRLGLGNLFAVAENYPDLKANDNFLHLQSRITGLENSIADRREFYNESANNNNVRIEQFPDILLASRLNFKAAELLEFDEEEIRDVNVGTLFG